MLKVSAVLSKVGIVTNTTVLRIPSERFYAVTGFPLKKAGSVPADLAYLDSPKIAGLSNLSADINRAARNAFAAMIDYIVAEYGYDRAQPNKPR